MSEEADSLSDQASGIEVTSYMKMFAINGTVPSPPKYLRRNRYRQKAARSHPTRRDQGQISKLLFK